MVARQEILTVRDEITAFIRPDRILGREIAAAFDEATGILGQLRSQKALELFVWAVFYRLAKAGVGNAEAAESGFDKAWDGAEQCGLDMGRCRMLVSKTQIIGSGR